MDLSVYEVEAEIEASHWWFAGRRRLLARELDALGAKQTWRVLDIGSGTGGNLRLLSERAFAARFGMDSSLAAASLCAKKRLGAVTLGDATKLPFPDGAFDLVLAMDVLEHVERDDLAAAEIRRVLTPGGSAIVTVPAFDALWGPQDDLSHHLRRYRIGPFCALLEGGGLRLRRAYHFNFILFFPILVARRLLSAAKVRLRSENEVNSPAINAVLKRLFAFDVDWAAKLRLPFGVSILAVADRAP